MIMINHLALLYKISQLKEKLYIDLLRKLEIKNLMPVHINILLVIDKIKDKPIIVNVAKELCKSKADTSAVISTLVKKGYITCKVLASDRRSKLLTLTPKAQEIIKKAALIKEQIDSILLNKLNSIEKDMLHSYLLTAGNNLEIALKSDSSLV
ncbi:hypothetical protein [Spiroplasma endosymbiont of Clivina fossor]|uniref:MarR family winged helix-turn-helix transcriptional regulator n=1 Tax=Spiroplasma endosymbiont of Clivina fossor TaxID=3066282 RepID=UPI00313F17C0